MAYMSQQKKKELSPGIKKVFKKYNMKGSIAVKNHSTLIVNVKSGPICFEKHERVNEYWVERDYSGTAKNFLSEMREAMDIGNFDKSDPQTDYFHLGWYIDINIGKWDKEYIRTT